MPTPERPTSSSVETCIKLESQKTWYTRKKKKSEKSLAPKSWPVVKLMTLTTRIKVSYEEQVILMQELSLRTNLPPDNDSSSTKVKRSFGLTSVLNRIRSKFRKGRSRSSMGQPSVDSSPINLEASSLVPAATEAQDTEHLRPAGNWGTRHRTFGLYW